MSVVLDASAIIAMLKGERGAAKVAAEVGGARVSSVNYAEVVSHFVHAGMPEREVDAMLDPLPLTVVPADKALAQIAGRLRAATAEAIVSAWHWHGAMDCPHEPATRTGRRSLMPLRSRLSRSADLARLRG
jgi:hypothetical protein